MKQTHYIAILPCVLLIISMLTGCLSTSTHVKQGPYDDHIMVSFKELKSGLFHDDYRNKFVKVECEFRETARAPIPPYSSNEYMQFYCMAPKGDTYEIANYLTVLVPKSIAKEVFDLQFKDLITVYGQARQYSYKHSITGQEQKSLLIQAEHIEE